MAVRVENIDKQTWIDMSKEVWKDDLLPFAVDVKYKPMYEGLRPMGGSKISWNKLLTVLHVAYAWMPTMLWKNGNPLILDKESMREFRQTYTRKFNRFLVENTTSQPSADEIEYLKKYANNSVVGLSKVLHILDPKNFPIWDSRVAKNFFYTKQEGPVVGEKVNWYLKWLATSREWASDPAVIDRCKVLRKKFPFLKGFENLRLVELVVFCW